MELTSLYYRLRSLTAYRPLLEQPVLRSAVSLLDHLSGGAGEPALDAWAEFCFQLEKAGAEGPGSWLLEQLRYCDAPWPRAVESGCSLPGGELSAQPDEDFSALSALDSASLRQTLAALLPRRAVPPRRSCPFGLPGPPLTLIPCQTGTGHMAPGPSPATGLFYGRTANFCLYHGLTLPGARR